MSTERRLILPAVRLPSDGGLLEVTADEQRYLRKVLRLQVGAQLTVRDGEGGEWSARVHDRTTIELSPRRQVPRPLLPRTTLNFCPPKGRRLDLLLEKATELGCHALRPIRAERSVRIIEEPTPRWLSIIHAAGAQADSAWLPRLEEPMPLMDALHNCAQESEPPIRVIAHPSGRPFGSALESFQRHNRVEVFTGPEGGFTEREVREAIHTGAIPVSLGPTILRAETAPIVALAMIHALTWNG